MHVQNSAGFNLNQTGITSNNNQASFRASRNDRQYQFGQFGNKSNITLTILILNLIQSLLQSLSQSNTNPNIGNTTSGSSTSNMNNMGDRSNTVPMDDMATGNDASSVSSKHLFNTPVGATAPGPALPGNSYETTFTAAPGEKLSFASMFVQSNDLFFAPDEYGIPLFDQAGQPLEGDVTNFVSLWDAGTELNEPAGTGENQPPRQSDPNTGVADPDQRVRKVYDIRGELPPVNELLKAEVEYLGDNQFKLKLTNISDSSSLASPFAPGIAVVHSNSAPIFNALQADRGLGLEALAEDGDPSMLLAQL